MQNFLKPNWSKAISNWL